MNLPAPPVLAAEERAWNYWFADGITNVVVGVTTLLMALCLRYTPRYPLRPFPLALWLTALILYVLMGARHRQIVEWLKTKTTYPRTGYVRPPYSEDPAAAANLTALALQGPGMPPEVQMQRMQRQITWMIVIALVAVGGFAFSIIRARWIWTAAGVLFSTAMIIARKEFRLSWIMPLGFPMLGLATTTFAPRHHAPAFFLAGMGLLILLDGAEKLIRYLLSNPRPKADA